MRVRVLRRHINKGKPFKAMRCPVALALRERVGGRPRVCVGLDTIRVNGSVYPVSAKVRQWIAHFDCDGYRASCKPFTFTLV